MVLNPEILLVLASLKQRRRIDGMVRTGDAYQGCAFAVYLRKRERDDYGRGEKVSDPKMKEIGD